MPRGKSNNGHRDKKNNLDEAVREELDKLDESGLRKVIADSTETIELATRERNANEKYQQAKLVVSDLSAGLKDVKTYQGGKIKYSLQRLRELRGGI